MILFLILAFLELNFADPSNNELNRDRRGTYGYNPVLTWYGDTGTATISSRSGIWNQNYKLTNMFDSNDATYWHSERRFEHTTKPIRIDFRV